MAKQDVSVRQYESKLSQNPRSLVFSRLADCYRKNGEIQQAIGVCMDGLKHHPDSVTGRVILGRCYLEQEKLKEATAEFVKAVELDRRNQVAVKMIADVYARQGMREKAGDLYNYLLGMDPDNQSLARLGASFKGTGATGINDIMGFSRIRRAPVDAASADTIVDADRTIQMERAPAGPDTAVKETGELADILIKTQKFEAGELSTAAGRSAGGVEELASETAKSELGVVTGDDISSRMTAIFEGEQGFAAQESVQEEVLDVQSEPVLDISEEKATAAAEETAGRVPSADEPLVSGTDISSRIEQLFGEENKSTVVPSEADFTRLFEARAETVQKADLGETSLAAAPTKELKLKDIIPEDTSISGDDITDRLGQMFEESHPAQAAEVLEIKEEETIEPEAVEAKEKGARPAPVAADDTRVKEPEEADPLSGDDVALRLETIFEEGEEEKAEAQQTAEQTAEQTLPAVTDEGGPRPEEDTKTPFDMGEEQIVVEDAAQAAKNDEEDTFSASETIAVSAQTLPASPSATSGRPKEKTKPPDEITIDDTVTQEERPEMSGDDVAGRLDELFSEDLEKDMAALDSIPDEDKAEESSKGFYTISGEDAGRAAPDDALLAELDKVDIGGEGQERLEPVKPSDEKTVLLDQETEDTMLADEETIAADGRDPFLPRPETDTQRAEGSGVRSQDRTEMMPTEETVAYDDEEEKTRPADRPYSIPDHVLTPTLADIYFQQGQPQLAQQIYKRLLDADPDNERIARRLKEIEEHIDSIAGLETIAIEPAPPRKTARPDTDRTAAPVRRPKEPERGKPLAGVRIRKKFKSRLKKKR
jgi:tetratricopeptide (TPR) repeat protein